MSASSNKFLVVVGGPTASGKTALGVHLAQQFQSVVLSGDSRQFYRQMNIGTAKPTLAERQGVPHYFIDTRDVWEPYSVGDFERDALALLAELYQHHDLVFLVGGSGLYLKALCEGLDPFPPVDPALKAELEAWYHQAGLAALQAAVAAADPAYFAVVDQQNPMRLLRALAVVRSGGRPYSDFRQEHTAGQPRFFTPIYLGLELERSVLYQRINQRVAQMLASGLLAEVQALLPYRHYPALDTVGYQELFAHLDGQMDLPTAVELIQRNSRRYAKRQLTWMRRDGFWQALHPTDWEGALAILQKRLGQ